MKWLLTPLYRLVWDISVAPVLAITDAFSKLFSWLSFGLTNSLIFQQDGASVSKQFVFHWNGLPAPFFGFIGIAVFMMIIIWCIQYFQAGFNQEINPKERLVKSAKATLKAAVLIVATPFVFFFLNLLSYVFVQMLYAAFGLTSDMSVANIIYEIGDPKFAGVLDPKNLPSDIGFKSPKNIWDFNYIVELLGSFTMMFSLLLMTIEIIIYSAELFVLFIVSPVMSATMIEDEGAKWKQWQTRVIHKFIQVFVLNLVFCTMEVLLPALIKAIDNYPGLKKGNAWLLRMGWDIVVVFGMAKYLADVPGLIGGLFGLDASETAGMGASFKKAAGLAGVSTLVTLGTEAKMFGGAMKLGGHLAGKGLNKLSQKTHRTQLLSGAKDVFNKIGFGLGAATGFAMSGINKVKDYAKSYGIGGKTGKDGKKKGPNALSGLMQALGLKKGSKVSGPQGPESSSPDGDSSSGLKDTRTMSEHMDAIRQERQERRNAYHAKADEYREKMANGEQLTKHARHVIARDDKIKKKELDEKFASQRAAKAQEIAEQKAIERRKAKDEKLEASRQFKSEHRGTKATKKDKEAYAAKREAINNSAKTRISELNAKKDAFFENYDEDYKRQKADWKHDHAETKLNNNYNSSGRKPDGTKNRYKESKNNKKK